MKRKLPGSVESTAVAASLYWLLPCAAAGLLLGVASVAEAKNSASRTLTVALNGPVASTEFSTKHDHDTSVVLHHVYEGLVGYKDNLTVGGVIAESFTVSEDLKTYRFRLRDDVVFHNGEPLRAADVKWSFERHMDRRRNWGSHCREWLDGSAEEYHRPVTVVDVSTPDERTVVFELQSKSSMFLHLLANEHCIFPVIHRDSVASDGTWKAPIATGPYMLKSWNAGAVTELQKFPRYRKVTAPRSGFTGMKEAWFDVIRFLPVSNPEEARAALSNGTVDSWFDAPVSVALSLQDRDQLLTQSAATPAWHMLMIQTRTDPLLQDVRVRQAIAHAIDIDQVTRKVQGKFGKANPSAVATASPFYSAVHQGRSNFDPSKSRALLREAGYRDEPLRIMAAKSPYPSFYDAAVEMAALLRAAGLNVTVQETSWKDVLKSYEDNSYQMISMTYSQRLHPSLMYSALIGRRADHGWYIWEDGEAGALTAYSTIVGETAQQEIFDGLHREMLELAPAVGIYDAPVITVSRRDIKGFQPWAVGFARYWGVRRE